MMGSGRWRMLTVLLLLVLTACAHPPVRELRTYTEAFSAARTVSDVLYNDMAAAQEVAAKRERNASFPEEFKPQEDLDKRHDIQARRRALDVVVTYNEILLKLAEGRTVEELRSALGPLQQSVSTVLGFVASGAMPLIGPALRAIGTALEAAERARSRAEFTRAGLAGHEDVIKIIAFLIDDTKDLYKARKSVVEFELTEAKAQAGEVRQAMVVLAGKYRLPPPGSTLAQGRTNVELELNRLFNILRPGAPVQSLLGAAGDRANTAPAYSDEITALLVVRVEQLRRAVERHQQGVNSLNEYHRMLRDYVLLLDHARQSVVVLKAAVEAPKTNAIADTAEALEFAIDMRNQARAILAAYHQWRAAE